MEWFGIDKSDKNSRSSASVDSDEMLAYGKRYMLWDPQQKREEEAIKDREAFFRKRLREMREKKFGEFNITKYPQKQKGLVLS